MKDIGMNNTDGVISYPDVHWWGSEAPRGGGISEAVAHELQLILESSEQESGGDEPPL